MRHKGELRTASLQRIDTPTAEVLPPLRVNQDAQEAADAG